MEERNGLASSMASIIYKDAFLFVLQLNDLLRGLPVAAVLLPVYLTFKNALRMTADYINSTEKITPYPPYWTSSIMNSEL